MISILVVEDDKIKRTAYNDIFNKLNIPIERIDCCESINSAKEKLYTRQYDVMILDLVLPRRTGDSVESSGGKDLLNEILEYSNHFHIPNNIFVVSAYEDPMLEFRECMNNTYFASIKYDSSCSAWHEQLSSYLSQILRTLNSDNLTYDYDTAIICALSDPELKQVRELPFDWKPYRHPGDITSYYTGNYNSKKLICAASYEMGMPAAAILASKMVLHFRPHYLIMTGIAGCAKSEELHFGDIMIADPCFDYGSGKKVIENGNSVFKPDYRQVRMEPKVLQAIQQVVENQDLLRRIKDEFQGMKPQNELKAKIGPFGSGASVLADSLAIQDVKEHARKLLGFDMEAYAVMLAGTISSDLSSYPIVIKSVSDFGTEEKGDEYQEYAAYTSARLIPPLLEQLFPN